jgi:phage gp36-like protein
MSYATIANLIDRYDAREIGDLIADDNNRKEAIDLADDPILTAFLQDASGQVEAALVVAERYSAAELSGLTGNSAAHLVRITCDIAMSLLATRRPGRLKTEARKAIVETAEAHLERLRKGENIFNLADQREAGAPSIGGPSTLDLQNLNLVRDRTRNYYPGRRLPDNR